MASGPVGDRGQRYEVRATGYPKEGESVIGWSVDRAHAILMAQTIIKAPSCIASVAYDRVDKRAIWTSPP